MHSDVKPLTPEHSSHYQRKTALGRLILWVTAVLASMLTVALLPTDLQAELRHEASSIELLSALCLFVSCVIFLRVRPFWEWGHISLLAFLLAEREFEPKAFAPDSVISKLGHWIDDQFLQNKAVIAVLAIWLLVGFLRFTGPYVLDQIKRRTKAFGLISTSVVLAATSQVFEAVGKAQLEGSYWAHTFFMWEELLELYFAMSIVAFAIAVLKPVSRT